MGVVPLQASHGADLEGEAGTNLRQVDSNTNSVKERTVGNTKLAKDSEATGEAQGEAPGAATGEEQVVAPNVAAWRTACRIN